MDTSLRVSLSRTKTTILFSATALSYSAVQHRLRPLAQVGLELLVGVRIDLLALEVEQHDGPFVLEELVEHAGSGQDGLGGLDQIVVGAVRPFLGLVATTSSVSASDSLTQAHSVLIPNSPLTL